MFRGRLVDHPWFGRPARVGHSDSHNGSGLGDLHCKAAPTPAPSMPDRIADQLGGQGFVKVGVTARDWIGLGPAVAERVAAVRPGT